MNGLPRKAHAVTDLPSRLWKAEKIVRLLELPKDGRRRRLLDIGAGNGGIAHALAHHPGHDLEVTAVDQTDLRQQTAGYSFVPVESAELPFADECFDIVVSNHVLEHVGERPAQRLHLAEMRRVLAKDGLAYLALPNRWAVMEPHYRLPFLSWLPAPMADLYVKSAGRNSHYDCRPLGPNMLDRLVREAGFSATHHEFEALQIMASLESTLEFAAGTLRRLPKRARTYLRPLWPTLICVLRRTDAPAHARPD
jgi:SAM-dependent methyltransferase